MKMKTTTSTWNNNNTCRQRGWLLLLWLVGSAVVLTFTIPTLLPSALAQQEEDVVATAEPVVVYRASFYSTRELEDAVEVWLANQSNNNNATNTTSTTTTTSSSYEYQSLMEKYGPIEEWKTERIFDFANLFNAKRKPLMADVMNVDLSQWDVSNAESFIDMFLGCTEMDFDVSNWDVSNVIRFNGMFDGAIKFQGHGLSNWNVVNGKYFSKMFAETLSLDMTVMDIRNWNVRNALDMQEMFRDSNFGGTGANSTNLTDSTTTTTDNNDNNGSNLCSWNDRLYPTVNTTDMFLDSACSDPTDPDLKNRTNAPISLCVPCEESPQQQQQPRRPNVLFVMTDQQRFDAIRYVQDSLSRYDEYLKINTPNLDKLLLAGAYFENAYTQCAVCAPARTVLRTGCTVERTGIQHNDLIYEYVNGPLFVQRVEALEGLDHVLVEQYGYISEYYGKWHIPDKLLYNKKNKSSEPVHNIIHYNDYDYTRDEYFFIFESEEPKLKRYLEYYHDDLGVINQTLAEGQQYDTFTGYPYTPIQLDSRYDSATGTPLTEGRGFEIYEITQPNVVGRYGLDENYTPTHFTGSIALGALQRLLTQSDPWLLTVSFHNPHPPMVPASAYLDYYWSNRDKLFVSPSIDDDGNNTAYGRFSDMMPEYGDPVKVQEWTALYYALIEEIDDHVGQLLDTLEAAADNNNSDDAYANTLVIFTSDHGEMLGAHGRREKNNFYEESSRVPLFMSWPGVINAGTVVKEKVSLMDVFATILDYAGLSESDHSDGSSLRPLIEGREINQEYDEDVVFAEWDFRKPPEGYGSSSTTTPGASDADESEMNELEDAALDRAVDDRPSFLVRKGSYKLMMQKLASSAELDMMFNLDDDPYETNNLIGLNAATASNETIIKAEYMRCLLLGWMIRMNGDQGYFSDPAANYGEGLGDISEVLNRQSWRPVGFWTSASSDNNTLEFGRVAWTGTSFVRNEHLFMGTRLDEVITVTTVTVTGADAALFSVDTTSLEFGLNACESVRVTFNSPSILSTTSLDASLILQLGDAGTVIITLTLSDFDFESQVLGYPPPPTLSPTMTSSPTVLSEPPSKSPSKIPTIPTGSPETSDGSNNTSVDANNQTEDLSATPSDFPSVAPFSVFSTPPAALPSSVDDATVAPEVFIEGAPVGSSAPGSNSRWSLVAACEAVLTFTAIACFS